MKLPIFQLSLCFSRGFLLFVSLFFLGFSLVFSPLLGPLPWDPVPLVGGFLFFLAVFYVIFMIEYLMSNFIVWMESIQTVSQTELLFSKYILVVRKLRRLRCDLILFTSLYLWNLTKESNVVFSEMLQYD